MYFCTNCKLDFDAERRKDVTVKCIKCGSSKNVVDGNHPLARRNKHG